MVKIATVFYASFQRNGTERGEKKVSREKDGKESGKREKERELSGAPFEV